MDYHKTCALCPNKIPPYKRLCLSCYSQYAEYMDEAWFREIEKAQQHQDQIDKAESSLIPFDHQTNIYGVQQNDGTGGRRSAGRPPKKYAIVNEVLQIHDNDPRLSLRAIANKVKEGGHYIGYVTVRHILNRYRPNRVKEAVQ